MNKPETLKDLMIGQHIGRNEIEAIARTMFDGKTTAAGPEGYIITAVAYDDLPKHVRDFVMKAILEFSVENVLDANDAAKEADSGYRDALEDDDDEKGDLGSPDPFNTDEYEGH